MTTLAPMAPTHSAPTAGDGGGVLVVLTTRRTVGVAFGVVARTVASHCTVVLRREGLNIQIALSAAAFGFAWVGAMPDAEEVDAMTLGRFAFALDLVSPLAIEWRLTSGSLVAEARRELMSRDYSSIVIAVPSHALGRMRGRRLAAKLERWAPVDVVWNRGPSTPSERVAIQDTARSGPPRTTASHQPHQPQRRRANGLVVHGQRTRSRRDG